MYERAGAPTRRWGSDPHVTADGGHDVHDHRDGWSRRAWSRARKGRARDHGEGQAPNSASACSAWASQARRAVSAASASATPRVSPAPSAVSRRRSRSAIGPPGAARRWPGARPGLRVAAPPLGLLGAADGVLDPAQPALEAAQRLARDVADGLPPVLQRAEGAPGGLPVGDREQGLRLRAARPPSRRGRPLLGVRRLLAPPYRAVKKRSCAARNRAHSSSSTPRAAPPAAFQRVIRSRKARAVPVPVGRRRERLGLGDETLLDRARLLAALADLREVRLATTGVVRPGGREPPPQGVVGRPVEPRQRLPLARAARASRSAPRRQSVPSATCSASATIASLAVRACSCASARARRRSSRRVLTCSSRASSRCASSSRSPTACGSTSASRTRFTTVVASSGAGAAGAEPLLDEVDLHAQVLVPAPVEDERLLPGPRRARSRPPARRRPSARRPCRRSRRDPTRPRPRCQRQREGPPPGSGCPPGRRAPAGAAGLPPRGRPGPGREGGSGARGGRFRPRCDVRRRCRLLGHARATVSESTVAVCAGAPSSAPPATPAAAISWTTSRPEVTVPKRCSPASVQGSPRRR